jgi:hypothetical protein
MNRPCFAGDSFEEVVQGIRRVRDMLGPHRLSALMTTTRASLSRPKEILRQNVGRLCDLARFITRNLPFVEHIAHMGLEPMGYAVGNWNEVWADPADYQPVLVAAVEEMAGSHLNVSIYNHQLCVLDERLWPIARKSISDWKNEYLPVCAGCHQRTNCGGLFASACHNRSRSIHAL